MDKIAGYRRRYVSCVSLCLIGFGSVLFCGACAPGRDSENDDANAVRYPKRVNIPDSLPSTDFVTPKRDSEVGVDKQLIFPIAIYSFAHYDGWQDCLRRYLDGKMNFGEDDWTPPAIATGERYSQMGRKAGYGDCKAKLTELRKQMDNADVFEGARDAYFPRRKDSDEEDVFAPDANGE